MKESCLHFVSEAMCGVIHINLLDIFLVSQKCLILFDSYYTHIKQQPVVWEMMNMLNEKCLSDSLSCGNH